MEGTSLRPDGRGNIGQLLPEQDLLRFLIRAASETLHRSASGGLRAACGWGGVLEHDRDRPGGGPERAGKGEGRSASLHLSSYPLLHCGLMGQERGRGSRKPRGAATGPTSCLTPRKGKVSSENSQTPPQSGWGLSRMGVDGFPPPHSLCYILDIQSGGEGGGCA